MNQSAMGVIADKAPQKHQESMIFESGIQQKLISRLQTFKSLLISQIERLEKLLLLADEQQS